MSYPVVHFEIGGRDGPKLRKFYEEMFAWRIDATDPSYGLVAEEAGGIGGGIMQIREGMEPYVTVYVSVEDLVDALARAEQLGGHRVVEPTPIAGIGEFALVSDPEGNIVGLLRVDQSQT